MKVAAVLFAYFFDLVLDLTYMKKSNAECVGFLYFKIKKLIEKSLIVCYNILNEKNTF